jgi:ArsR family transcriptional regulator, arsenate/arsenite/antimonite-responsive transcriptional repressor
MPADGTDRVDLVFRALASKPRREILRLLATHGAEGDARCCSRDEVCACVFAERLGLSAPTVSHHMKSLLDAGLVTAEKRGLWVYYRLQPEAMAEVVRELQAFAACASEECR